MKFGRVTKYVLSFVIADIGGNQTVLGEMSQVRTGGIGDTGISAVIGGIEHIVGAIQAGNTGVLHAVFFVGVLGAKKRLSGAFNYPVMIELAIADS